VASTITVKRALAALAAGESFLPADTGTDDWNAERVVADAETAVRRLDTAADFLAAGGETRLRRAVARAEADDRRVLARRGQRVLATVARFRAVATDTRDSAGDSDDSARNRDDPAGDSDDSVGDRQSRDRPTESVKRGGDQPPSR
jgi:hypothetical protein